MSYFDDIDQLILQGQLEDEAIVGKTKLRFRTLTHAEEALAINRAGVNVLAIKVEHLTVALISINGQTIEDKDRDALREKLGKMPLPYVMQWYEPLDKLLKKVPLLTEENLKDPLVQSPPPNAS